MARGCFSERAAPQGGGRGGPGRAEAGDGSAVLCHVLCTGVQGRFLSPFIRDTLGLSNQQIGYVFGAGTVVGLFSTPVWSALCDYLQRKRLVISVIFGGGAASALLYLLPLTTTALNVFWWTLMARCLYAFYMSPAMGILDSVAVHTLASMIRPHAQDESIHALHAKACTLTC